MFQPPRRKNNKNNAMSVKTKKDSNNAKLTKKAQTLTVINTALQEDKEDGNLTTGYWFLGSIVNGVRMSFCGVCVRVFIMQTFCENVTYDF